MRAWLLLLLSLVVVVAACSSDERSPAPPSVLDAPRVKPPADLAPRHARRAAGFLERAGALVTAGPTYEAAVQSNGAFAITPRKADVAPGPVASPRRAPLTLSTIGIARGDRALDVIGTSSIDEDGNVSVRRGSVVERIENEGTGIEQTWRFARAPAGEGDLVIRVAANGERFRTTTDHGLHFDGDALGLRYGTATWIDARGTRTTVVPRFASNVNGGVIELVVPGDVVERSAFPAILDPTITAEREVDQPAAVTPAPGDQGNPTIVSLGAGKGYFSLWHDRRSIRPAFVGTRIASNGTVTDQTGIAIVSGVATTAQTPALFASPNGLLVVWSVYNFDQWQDPGIYALRLDANGTPLDAGPIAVVKNTPNLPTPAAAFDGTNWLLTWQRYNQGTKSYEISGVRLSANGAVVDATPSVILASKEYLYPPDVSFNGTSYFLTYLSSTNIYAQLVGTDVKPIGAPENLLSSSYIYDYSVAFDGTRHHVVYNEYVAGYVLGARRYNKQAQPLDGGTKTVLPSGTNVQSPRATFDGTNVLVTWIASGTGIQAARIAPATGALVDATAQTVLATPDYIYEYGLAADGPGGMIAFREYNSTGGTSYDVSGVKITASGGLSGGKQIAVSNAANSETEAAVAWNGSTYFSTWLDTRDGQPTLWGASIGADGTPGIAVKLFANPVGGVTYTNPSRPRIATNGTTFFITFGAQQSGCSATCIFRSVFGLVVDAKGAIQGKLIDLVPSGSSTTAANLPDVAFDGTDYLVVFEESSDGAGISGRRVKTDGTPVDDKLLRISPVTPGFSENRKAPSIAFNGAHYFVAWQTTRPTANNIAVGHIFGTRVEKEGTSLDGEIAICNAFLLQSGPRVAGDPKNGFFVVWDDYRTSLDSADIYGGRISPEGQLLDGDKGRAITTGEADESRPSVAAAGESTGWIVAWRDLRTKQAYDIYGSWISAAGAVRDPKGFLFSAEGGDEETPALSGGPAGKLLLTYTRLDPRTGYGSYRLRSRAIETGKPVGQACANGDECGSRACVDGFCCSTDCDGCGTCSATPGTCTARAAGSESPRCNYRCKGALECPTECAENSDCATGATCDKASKKCVTRQICIDQKTLQDLTGKQTDCAPYTCAVDTCRTSCASVDDCAQGFVCDQAGRCVPPPNAADATGCSVSAVSSEPRGGLSVFAATIGVVLAIASRRRRRLRALTLVGTSSLSALRAEPPRFAARTSLLRSLQRGFRYVDSRACPAKSRRALAPLARRSRESAQHESSTSILLNRGYVQGVTTSIQIR